MRKIMTLGMVMLVVSASLAMGQNDASITGQVTDAGTGESLPGVNILVKGTTAGTSTDSEGNYDLRAPSLNDTLIYSFVGYQSKEVLIAGRTEIDVALQSQALTGEELVVVGYGTQKETNLTGAVETITLNDIESRSLTNTSQALQGKASGILVTQISGQPGQDEAQIRIRGISSIENNNEPLVIIDGIEGNINDVNPNDIKSMSVLKDASSAAIYGNRAAGGVIIIETKEGRGGLHVNYSGSVSYQQPTALPDVVDATTYARRYNEARLNSGFPITYTDEDIARYEAGDDPEYQSVDWYDKYFSPSVMDNHYMSIGGGNQQYQFSASGGYLNQDGVLYGTSAGKLDYRVKLSTHHFDDKLDLGLLLSGYRKDEEELTSSTPTVLTLVANTRPTTFFQSSEGLYSYPSQYFATKKEGGGITRQRDKTKYQFSATLQPLDGLEAKVMYGNYKINYTYTRFVPNVSIAGNVFDGAGSFIRSSLEEQTQWQNYNTLNSTVEYEATLLAHDFSFLTGFESIKYGVEGYDASVQDLSANEPVLSLGDPSTRTAGGFAQTRTSRSFFGRFNYAFKNKYLLEATVRRDGSSRFAKGNQWGTFPSFSAGWRISEENFLQPVDFITSMKLRASWGRLGNESIQSYYAASDVLSSGQFYSFGGEIVPGTATTLLANPATTWETTEQTNIGLDLELINRLNITFDYFRKHTYDILARINIPSSLGVSTNPYQNVGEMENKGWELGLKYLSKPQKDFTYSANLSLSYLQNEVLDLGELDYISHDDVISGYQPPSGIIRSEVGRPFGSYYGYIMDGIYQTDDFVWQNNSDTSIPFEDRDFTLKENQANPSGIMPNPMPGDIIFRDRNEDRIIDENDKTIIGNSLPDYVFSFNFNAGYKNFDLNLMAQGIYGAEAYLMGALQTPFWNGNGNITQDMADNRWTPENPSSTNQQLYSDVQRANIISTYYLEDASYLRIKNMRLGYSIPVSLLERVQVRSLKVYMNVENAFTFSSFNGFDPERTTNRITSDYHPQIRIYSLGVNLNF